MRVETTQSITHHAQTPSANPYIGPRSFEGTEEANFFGRAEEIRQLTSMVIAHRAVLLHAQSGAGKTSLLKAGVIPELKRRKKIVVLPISRVGGQVPAGIHGSQVQNIYVFNALFSLLGTELDAQQLTGLNLREGLQRLVEPSMDGARRRPHLLVLDQFEELFTTNADRYAERADFFRQVQECLLIYPALSLLLSMRDDYIARLDPYVAQLPDRLRIRFYLERLTAENALAAVEKPAAAAGRRFAPGVAQNLVDNLRRIQTAGQNAADVEAPQLGEYVEPVHLQIVCQQLWAGLPADRTTIRAEDVQTFGDVDQALIGFYSQILKDVVQQTAVSERRLRTWCSEQLITPARTRGLVYRGQETTQGLPNAAVDLLAKAWLIRAELRGGETWYELAHDRLVEPVLKANLSTRQKNYIRPRKSRHSSLWGDTRERLTTGEIVPVLSNAFILEEAFATPIKEIVRALGESYQYPFPIAGKSLSSIAQFVWTNFSDRLELNENYCNFIKNFAFTIVEASGKTSRDVLEEVAEQFDSLSVSELCRQLGLPDRIENPSAHPLAVLANLPIPIYLTTSYHEFLEMALQQAGKEPYSTFCNWTPELSAIPQITDEKGYEPSVARPLVFHLYGVDTYPSSMALHEDSLLQFFVNLAGAGEWDNELLPRSVDLALRGRSPLLIGYDRRHWEFKVMMEIVLKPRSAKRPLGFIQLETLRSADEREAMKFFDAYFASLGFKVYEGSQVEVIDILRHQYLEA